jgi:hypothetical protein
LVGGEHPPACLLPDLGENRLLNGDLPSKPVKAKADQPLGLPAGDHVNGGGQRGPVLQVEGAAAALLRKHADDAVPVAPGPRPDFSVLVGNRGPHLDLPAGTDPRIADQPQSAPPVVHIALGRSYSPAETAFPAPETPWSDEASA